MNKKLLIKVITRCVDCDHFAEGGNLPHMCYLNNITSIYILDKYDIPDNCPLEDTVKGK